MKRGFLNKGSSGQSTKPTDGSSAVIPDGQDSKDTTSLPGTVNPPLQKLALKNVSLADFEQQGMKFKLLDGISGNRAISVLGFGTSAYVNAFDTLIITYAENRIPLRKHPGFATHMSPELAARNASFVEVVPKPGKGLSLIAKRDIPAREVFVRERPLLYMLAQPPYDLLMNMDELLKHMSHDRKDAYGRLCNSKPRGPHMVDSLSIARTNAFAVDVVSNDPHLCVCDVLSRANHDCTPNAFFHFNYETFCGELWSQMPIRAGTEVTITYTKTTSPTAERKADLKQKWGFDCNCAACDDNSPSHKVSEERRRILQRYFQTKDISETDESYTEWFQEAHCEDSHIQYLLDLMDAEHQSE